MECGKRGILSYHHQLNAFLCKFLGGRLRGIASDAADLELLRELSIVQDVRDDGATLVASGTEDCDDLGHFD